MNELPGVGVLIHALDHRKNGFGVQERGDRETRATRLQYFEQTSEIGEAATLEKARQRRFKIAGQGMIAKDEGDLFRGLLQGDLG